QDCWLHSSLERSSARNRPSLSLPPVARKRVPAMMHRTTASFACVAVLACAWPSPAWAKPAHKKALADYFGPFLAKKLNDCQTCHLPDKTGDEDDKPHNPFGIR